VVEATADAVDAGAEEEATVVDAPEQEEAAIQVNQQQLTLKVCVLHLEHMSLTMDIKELQIR